MVKASGWPLSPELLAPGRDFNAPLADGLVPLHWAAHGGKAGLLIHMLEHGADVQAHPEGCHGLLALALSSKNFQSVMLVIDHLKAAAAPPPSEPLAKQLTHTFKASHTNAKNRLQQTLKDWARINRCRAL